MKEIPVRWGEGGPIVGTAQVSSDGRTCTIVALTAPAAAVLAKKEA